MKGYTSMEKWLEKIRKIIVYQENPKEGL